MIAQRWKLNVAEFILEAIAIRLEIIAGLETIAIRAEAIIDSLLSPVPWTCQTAGQVIHHVLTQQKPSITFQGSKMVVAGRLLDQSSSFLFERMASTADGPKVRNQGLQWVAQYKVTRARLWLPQIF